MVHVAEYHARFAHVHARELDDLQIQPDLIPRQIPQVAVIDHRLLPHRLERHPTLPRSKALLWPQAPSPVPIRPRQAPQRPSSRLRAAIYAASCIPTSRTKAIQGWLRIEPACEAPEGLREVIDPVVAGEVDLCLRTAGMKRTIKPFAKPRCQLA